MAKRKKRRTEDGILAASNMSVVSCEHGTVYVRFHDAKGKIFAVGGIDPGTAVRLIGDLEREATLALCGKGLACDTVH
jgi:hypothetical protein